MAASIPCMELSNRVASHLASRHENSHYYITDIIRKFLMLIKKIRSLIIILT